MLSMLNVASLELTIDVPLGSDNVLNATEDVPFVVTAEHFGYNSTQAYALTGVKIAALPGLGTLKLNGVDVVVDQIISRADLDLLGWGDADIFAHS